MWMAKCHRVDPDRVRFTITGKAFLWPDVVTGFRNENVQGWERRRPRLQWAEEFIIFGLRFVRSADNISRCYFSNLWRGLSVYAVVVMHLRCMVQAGFWSAKSRRENKGINNLVSPTFYNNQYLRGIRWI